MKPRPLCKDCKNCAIVTYTMGKYKPHVSFQCTKYLSLINGKEWQVCEKIRHNNKLCGVKGRGFELGGPNHHTVVESEP
jgi:hypothetical protein